MTTYHLYEESEAYRVDSVVEDHIIGIRHREDYDVHMDYDLVVWCYDNFIEIETVIRDGEEVIAEYSENYDWPSKEDWDDIYEEKYNDYWYIV